MCGECIFLGTPFVPNAMMSSASESNNSDIFSLRIVSIDNYMRAPVLGLDTCYSEFRAEAVKQVRQFIIKTKSFYNKKKTILNDFCSVYATKF